MTRIVYRSTIGYVDRGADVSGIVAVPDGDPPTGGWPIVALGHGTTGTDRSCGPSDSPDLLGQSGEVEALLRAGFVVAATDYQGLGHESRLPHPYLEPASAAYNMIDAVRAARLVVPDTSTRWVALGASQGGQAAWAAAEFAPSYGQGLDLRGAVALAPAADLSPITDGRAQPDYTYVQRALVPDVVAGLRVLQPDLPVSQYMRGALATGAPVLTSCTPAARAEKFSALSAVQPTDSEVPDPAARLELTRLLSRVALPQRAARSPILVVNGSDDLVVRAPWTDRAVARARALGETIEHRVIPGRGHTNLGATDDAIRWLTDRVG
ncbi:Lysophospholipase, alpha-beta hydrolase superfamily [Williamsia sterculiae]|uniref:Lysophospholipase, alpha-beta hydrolase superfamily n=1 Tax=Williamsia sterculiae TaxID=1344003 RepID=A0A1N7DH93_9NOCA|nr:Lysophospholipase, alpha-beta hydrolase superfamily [Williamsia sterculiae]